MNRTLRRLTVLLIVALVGWNIWLTQRVVTLEQSKSATTVTENTTVDRVVTDFTTDLTEVAAKTKQSTVSVSNYQQGQLVSSGSGAIYKVDGSTVYIVTNQHVVSDADQLEIAFSSGEVVRAQLIGGDTYADLAIVKVTAEGQYASLSFGDSDLVKAGEYVLAIGSPLGEEFSGSVTFGIISGVNRTVGIDLDEDGTEDWDMSLLQTDAAINPGNSGGPLVNMNGEIIGINSSKISTETVEGMGFAIPINDVQNIITQLETNGKVNRPVIGISAVDVSGLSMFERAYYGIGSEASGLFVTSVVDDGPADRAGIEKGDLLISFDGQEIESFKAFRKSLYTHQIGDKVKVIYERSGKQTEVDVTLD